MHASVGVSCGKIFVFGAIDSWKPLIRTDTVEMYDPETDIWEEKSSMPWVVNKFSNKKQIYWENCRYSCTCIPLNVPASYPSPIANIEVRMILKHAMQLVWSNFKFKKNKFLEYLDQRIPWFPSERRAFKGHSWMRIHVSNERYANIIC